MFTNKRRYLYIILLSVYSYLNIKFTEGDALLSEPISEGLLILIITALTLLIWEGDRLIFDFVKKRTSQQYRPLVLLLLFSIVWVVVLSVIGVGIQQILLGQVSWISLKLVLGFSFRVNLFLNCANAIVYYQQQLKQADLQAERLKKEQITAEFNALKRQVNPHFLFNSLNVLDSLVKENPDRASEFIERLSTVYRYLTSNEESELVTLKTELTFIEDYLFLVGTRYGKNLIVDIKINQDSHAKYLPPAALQIVVENAIKHNEISNAHPFRLSIAEESNMLVIGNNIQPKLTENESLGIGLENIRTRYEFLKQKIEVSQTAKQFTVRLPLIEVHD